MNPNPHEEFIKELLTDRNLEQLRSGSLERGMALARQRRGRRRAVRVGLTAIVLAAAVTWSARFRSIPASERAKTGPPEVPAAALAASQSRDPWPETTGVRQITDEELLAMFPGRAVALVGRAGDQKLVFLDRMH